jgi:hypothetical protein
VATFAVPAQFFPKSEKEPRKYSTVKTIAKTSRTKPTETDEVKVAPAGRPDQQGANAARASAEAARQAASKEALVEVAIAQLSGADRRGYAAIKKSFRDWDRRNRHSGTVAT